MPRPHESMEVRRASVTAGYFETMRIPLLEGRAFTADDGEKSPRVAIVDQTMANISGRHKTQWANGSSMYGELFTVVGVAKNSKHQQMNEPPEPLVYLSLFQFGGPQTIIHVRTAGDPHSWPRRSSRPSISSTQNSLSSMCGRLKKASKWAACSR